MREPRSTLHPHQAAGRRAKLVAWPGSLSAARRSERKAAWCHSSGWRTLRPQACGRRTADDLTWSCTGHPRRAWPCAVMLLYVFEPHQHSQHASSPCGRHPRDCPPHGGSSQARHIPGAEARRRPAVVRPCRRSWWPVESGCARFGAATRARQGAARTARLAGKRLVSLGAAVGHAHALCRRPALRRRHGTAPSLVRRKDFREASFESHPPSC